MAELIDKGALMKDIISRFGHTVFATRFEAEEALAKMGGKQ